MCWLLASVRRSIQISPDRFGDKGASQQKSTALDSGMRKRLFSGGC